MKAPDGGHTQRVQARRSVWTSDGQASMSKKGGSPELRIQAAIARALSAEQSAFMFRKKISQAGIRSACKYACAQRGELKKILENKIGDFEEL